jgi:hypothetical protein
MEKAMWLYNHYIRVGVRRRPSSKPAKGGVDILRSK